MSSSPAVRRALGALLAVLTPVLLVAGTAGTASAADGYRYWNYSHLEGDTFAFAQTGPGDYTPKDGDVEGWRFGTSTVKQGIAPRADLSEVNFDTVCAGTEAADGEKRVAVLIDFGTEADADGADVPDPRAECAVVPEKATGQQVVESVVDIRADGGLICALDGYPASGCGEAVSNAKVSADEDTVPFALPAAAQASSEPSAAAGSSASADAGTTDSDDTAAASAETEDDGTSTWLLVGVLVLVLVLAAVAIPLYRRNRDA